MSEIIAILERNPKTEMSIPRVDRTEHGAADAKGRLSSTFQTSISGKPPSTCCMLGGCWSSDGPGGYFLREPPALAASARVSNEGTRHWPALSPSLTMLCCQCLLRCQSGGCCTLTHQSQVDDSASHSCSMTLLSKFLICQLAF
jgi:hypothetical protein